MRNGDSTSMGARRWPMRWLGAAVLLAATLPIGPAAQACDICAIYTATELQESRTGLRIGVAQQISEMNDLQQDGRVVANPASERLTSAITQFVAGYQPNSRLGLQLTLPWIRRDYRRLRTRGVESGNETGFGDVSLLLSYAALTHTGESGVLRLSAIGGVKLPTGSTDRLREELPRVLDPNEVRDRLNENMGTRRNDDGPQAVRQAHVAPDGTALSGIHGHDLSLGTGSTDPILGAQLLLTWRRAVLASHAQYVLRTKGSHGYEYADEVTASINPGLFVLLDHRHSLVLQAATTIESKGRDSQGGQRVNDTALTAVYVGPGLHFTWGSALSLDFAVDLPAYIDNSALQIVPDFRLRAGLVWRR